MSSDLFKSLQESSEKELSATGSSLLELGGAITGFVKPLADVAGAIADLLGLIN